MSSFVSLRPGSRFDALYRTARRRRLGAITVFQAPSDTVLPSVGVVAGRSVGNAVQRNRAKRRLREAAHRVELRSNTAYVVVASPDVLGVEFGELVNWLSAAIVVEDGDRDKEAL